MKDPFCFYIETKLKFWAFLGSTKVSSYLGFKCFGAVVKEANKIDTRKNILGEKKNDTAIMENFAVCCPHNSWLSFLLVQKTENAQTESI